MDVNTGRLCGQRSAHSLLPWVQMVEREPNRWLSQRAQLVTVISFIVHACAASSPTHHQWFQSSVWLCACCMFHNESCDYVHGSCVIGLSGFVLVLKDFETSIILADRDLTHNSVYTLLMFEVFMSILSWAAHKDATKKCRWRLHYTVLWKSISPLTCIFQIIK